MDVKKTSNENLTIPAESDAAGQITNGVQAELQALAYQLWLDRGSPVGSPEIDWFEAEARIRAVLHTRGSARRQKAQRATAGIGRAR